MIYYVSYAKRFNFFLNLDFNFVFDFGVDRSNQAFEFNRSSFLGYLNHF